MNLIILIAIILINVVGSYCPNLCDDCIADMCFLCYSDFDASASFLAIPDPCNCPDGYYYNSTSSLCNFCHARCKTCVS